LSSPISFAPTTRTTCTSCRLIFVCRAIGCVLGFVMKCIFILSFFFVFFFVSPFLIVQPGRSWISWHILGCGTTEATTTPTTTFGKSGQSLLLSFFSFEILIHFNSSCVVIFRALI
jgi:hypothetical protein